MQFYIIYYEYALLGVKMLLTCNFESEIQRNILYWIPVCQPPFLPIKYLGGKCKCDAVIFSGFETCTPNYTAIPSTVLSQFLWTRDWQSLVLRFPLRCLIWGPGGGGIQRYKLRQKDGLYTYYNQKTDIEVTGVRGNGISDPIVWNLLAVIELSRNQCAKKYLSSE